MNSFLQIYKKAIALFFSMTCLFLPCATLDAQDCGNDSYVRRAVNEPGLAEKTENLNSPSCRKFAVTFVRHDTFGDGMIGSIYRGKFSGNVGVPVDSNFYGYIMYDPRYYSALNEVPTSQTELQSNLVYNFNAKRLTPKNTPIMSNCFNYNAEFEFFNGSSAGDTTTTCSFNGLTLYSTPASLQQSVYYNDASGTSRSILLRIEPNIERFRKYYNASPYKEAGAFRTVANGLDEGFAFSINPYFERIPISSFRLKLKYPIAGASFSNQPFITNFVDSRQVTAIFNFNKPKAENITNGAQRVNAILVYDDSTGRVWKEFPLVFYSLDIVHKLKTTNQSIPIASTNQGWKGHFCVASDGGESSFEVALHDGGLICPQTTARIKQDPNGRNPNKFGQLTAIVTSGKLQITYKHPICSDKLSKISIEVQSLVSSVVCDNIFADSFEVQILPTVPVFVHGLASSSATFDKMVTDIDRNYKTNYNALPFIFKNVDYSLTAQSCFAKNVNVVPNAIKEVKEIALQEGCAVDKVDLVGHSMGGLLSRIYIQSSNYNNDVRKLITLNTPHHGSYVANIIRTDAGGDLRNILNLKGYLAAIGWKLPDQDSCAIFDLKTTSLAIGNINNSVGSPAIRVNALATLLLDITGDLCGTSNLFPKKGIIDNVLSLVSCGLYNSGVGDGIVYLGSQKGGLPSNAVSLIGGNISHLAVTSNALAIKRVEELLYMCKNDNAFSDYSGYKKPVMGIVLAERGSLSVKIKQPTNDTILFVGQPMNVSVTGSKLTQQLIFISTNDDSVYTSVKNDTSAIHAFTLTPDLIGRRTLYAIGIDSISGELAIDSIQITVKTGRVGTSDLKTEHLKISVYPNPSDGRSLHITVNNATRQTAQLKIIDATARIIFSKIVDIIGETTQNIPIQFNQALDNGIYNVVLVMKEGLMSHKVSIMK
jgi:hypothetical protein